MTGAAAVEPALRTAALARLLSLGLSPPSEESLGHLAALARELAALDPSDEELAALASQADGAGLSPEFEALFGGPVRCPPYEGSYEADTFRQARQMADVAGFYRAFGAELAGAERDRPDSAGAELEFLAFLTARRLAADGEGARICAEAQDEFLRHHLGRWLGELCRRIEAETASPFYAALARLGGRFISEELERRGIEPAPLPERRRWSVEADTFACGPDDPPGLPGLGPTRAARGA